ncbi:hypothetical protein DXG01_016008, partial [Tephrocybe rancida]
MDPDYSATVSSSYRKACPCDPDRIFTTPGAFKNHSNHCEINKQSLWNSFVQAKEAREAKASARRHAAQGAAGNVVELSDSNAESTMGGVHNDGMTTA